MEPKWIQVITREGCEVSNEAGAYLTHHHPLSLLFLTGLQSSFRTSEPCRFDFLISLISSSCSLFSLCFFSKMSSMLALLKYLCKQSPDFFFFFLAEALRGCSQLFGPWVHFKRLGKKKKSWSCFLHRVQSLQPSGCAWAHLESTVLH